MFAVIGNPIAHSLSPVIHAQFALSFDFKISYTKILGRDFKKQVKDFFAKGGIGLNVTAPFKRAAYLLADVKLFSAQEVLCANTLWQQNGLIYAANTDGIGFYTDIKKYIAADPKEILVYGAGGAARGILPFARKLGKTSVCARNISQAQALSKTVVNLEQQYDLIINTTGADIHMPALIFKSQSLIYDLRYSVPSSGRTINGLGMLIEQAAHSFKIWHGVFPDTKKVFQSLKNCSIVSF